MIEHLPWQQSQWQRIESAMASNNLAHAYLLTGPEGLGKGLFARQLAQLLLCQSPAAGRACGKCHACSLLQTGAHPDLAIITPEEGARGIKVDQIRDLCQQLQQTSQLKGRRVIIIEPAELMNMAAVNSLLKSLEEPGVGVVFLLVSHHRYRLSATLISRCQTLAFAPDLSSETLNWVEQELNDSSQDPKRLLDLAAGLPFMALEYGGEAYQKRVAFFSDFDQLLQGHTNAIKISEKWHADSQYVLDWLIGWLNNFMVWQVESGSALTLPEGELSLCQRLSRTDNTQGLFAVYDSLLRAKQQLLQQQSINTQLLMDDILLQWVELGLN
ncbi:MAG: DNA polymerase III subunit delta' [Legionellales bacterium]|nr:DNA polymerase III subunit delta' [Legionellales bacterium]|tara:strand:- start:23250 stop:24233 length:984 start_codon:yes stop_codon:yes gene_type:complete